MSHCIACDKPIPFKYRTKAGDKIIDGAGQPIVEDLCDKCIDESRVSKPEDYYDGLYLDRNADECHQVLRKPADYLL